MSTAPSNKRKKTSDSDATNHNEESKPKEPKTEKKEEEKKYPTVVNSICHIDLPVLNVERASNFYRDAFTWSFMDWKPEYRLFIGASTQCVSGGLVLEESKNLKHFLWPLPQRLSILYLLSDDIPATLNLIHKSGGIVLKSKFLIGPGIGSQAYFYDTEGNYMALYSKNCDDIVETKVLEQTVQLKGTPHAVYEKFMDDKLHTAMMEASCTIDRKDGGEFKICEEYLTGRTIYTEKDHLIVQSWRAKDWPSGHFSTISLTLTADTKSGGTTVTLKQEGIPSANFEKIEKGWHSYYWQTIDK